MKKPNYKKALKGLMDILKTESESPDISSTSSKTTNEIEDVTQKSSDTNYQFTDHDLTVFNNKPPDKREEREEKLKK